LSATATILGVFESTTLTLLLSSICSFLLSQRGNVKYKQVTHAAKAKNKTRNTKTLIAFSFVIVSCEIQKQRTIMVIKAKTITKAQTKTRANELIVILLLNLFYVTLDELNLVKRQET